MSAEVQVVSKDGKRTMQATRKTYNLFLKEQGWRLSTDPAPDEPSELVEEVTAPSTPPAAPGDVEPDAGLFDDDPAEALDPVAEVDAGFDALRTEAPPKPARPRRTTSKAKPKRTPAKKG